MDSLLDDIADEHHRHLLEKGNLGPKRREGPSWSDDNSWVSQGYITRVCVYTCRCGGVQKSLIGIFHQERTPSGKIREQNLDALNSELQFPSTAEKRLEVSNFSRRICPDCVENYGFRVKG